MLVTPQSLAEWLDKHQGGSRICSVTMLTPLQMRKTHRDTREANPFLHDGESTIDHLSERLVFVGADYARMVNKAQESYFTTEDDGDYIPAFVAAALWNGKGHHVNSYVIEHTEKKSLYLQLLYAKTKGEDAKWVDKALKQEAWLDRFTGLEIKPDWNELAPYLPPPPKPSQKQGCQEGNAKEIMVRMPHLENVLMLRSFDLKQRGKYDIIQVKRTKYQISL